MTFVAHCRPISACCLATVCCLNLVQTPQSMIALVVMGDDTLSSNLVLNQASYMKVAEDRAWTKPTPGSVRVQPKSLVSLASWDRSKDVRSGDSATSVPDIWSWSYWSSPCSCNSTQHSLSLLHGFTELLQTQPSFKREKGNSWIKQTSFQVQLIPFLQACHLKKDSGSLYTFAPGTPLVQASLQVLYDAWKNQFVPDKNKRCHLKAKCFGDWKKSLST